MDAIALVTGFFVGALYNFIVAYITDKLSASNIYRVIKVTAICTGVTGLIAYMWKNIFTYSLLLGAGTVCVVPILFVLYVEVFKPKA